MNAYFENMIKDTNRSPSNFDFYELKVATRDEINNIKKLLNLAVDTLADNINENEKRISELQAKQEYMAAGIESADERICVLITAVANLRNQIAEMDTSTEPVPAVDTSTEPVPAVDTSTEPVPAVDTSVLVEALKLYAKPYNWKRQKRYASFRWMESPWKTAVEALRKAGIK